MTVGELAASLVAIDSVNPELVAGGAGEAEIAAHVAGWLRDAGLEVEVDEPVPGRPSAVGVARGRGGGASLMLNAHMDTVGVGGMARPFEPEVRDGRLHGRGAYDMKGSLAACMHAAATVASEGLAATILVPRGTAAARIAAIESEGATVEVVDGSYDDAVRRSAAMAGPRRLVLSDPEAYARLVA